MERSNQQPDVVGDSGVQERSGAPLHTMTQNQGEQENAVHSGPGSANPAFEADVNTAQLSPGVVAGSSNTNQRPSEPLPDLLPSHLLPPYVQARRNRHRETNRHRRRRRRSRRQEGTTQIEDPESQTESCSQSCCIRCVTTITAFRWVLVELAMLGVCCVLTGIVLGALHMTVGNSFLTLSLMFIGLGVMLVVVVGLGWKCTPQGHEPCHLLFNLGSHSSHTARRTLRSHSRHRHHWHGGVLYPEFRHRRPPPSYNTSQNDYVQQQDVEQGQQGDDYSLPSSPPPTYRSHASTVRTGVEITFPPQPNSRPPTYRSHVSESGSARPSLPREQNQQIVHEDSVNVEVPSSSQPNRTSALASSPPGRVKDAVRMFEEPQASSSTSSQPTANNSQTPKAKP